MEIKAVHIFQKIRLPSYAFFKCSTEKKSAGYMVTFTHKAQGKKKKKSYSAISYTANRLLHQGEILQTGLQEISSLCNSARYYYAL